MFEVTWKDRQELPVREPRWLIFVAWLFDLYSPSRAIMGKPHRRSFSDVVRGCGWSRSHVRRPRWLWGDECVDIYVGRAFRDARVARALGRPETTDNGDGTYTHTFTGKR